MEYHGKEAMEQVYDQSQRASWTAKFKKTAEIQHKIGQLATDSHGDVDLKLLADPALNEAAKQAVYDVIEGEEAKITPYIGAEDKMKHLYFQTFEKAAIDPIIEGLKLADGKELAEKSETALDNMGARFADAQVNFYGSLAMEDIDNYADEFISSYGLPADTVPSAVREARTDIVRKLFEKKGDLEADDITKLFRS